MISLDQVVLLQRKVEAAVSKIKSLNDEIVQLSSENDALRRKCAELTNALADKSGLVSSLEAEQNQIEQSILTALDQLDAVENSVLSSISASESEVNSSETVGNVAMAQVSAPVSNVQGSVVLNENQAGVAQINNSASFPENGSSVESQEPRSRILDPLAVSYPPESAGTSATGDDLPANSEESEGEGAEENQFDIF